MRAIFPGEPQSRLQAVSTADWGGLRVIAYITGNAVVVLNGPQDVIQTIYVDDVETLDAVAIEEVSGKIAISGGQVIHVYTPFGREEQVLRWSQLCSIPNQDAEGVSTLSWGSSEVLLIGGSRFNLWYISESDPPRCIWTQRLANATHLAHFSHDAGFIASCGQHDRVVKIWRRLSYEVDSTRFDVSYLAHPSAITNLHWRKPWHAEQNLDNLLYTFCADNRIRVWAHCDPHTLSVMQLVADMDMNTSIQPRRLSVGSLSRKRYGFVIDSRDFSRATEKAVQSSTNTRPDNALEHLVEIANRSPEICVVLDGLGHMSAWGLENAGCKNREATIVFNVAHVEGMNISFDAALDPLQNYSQIGCFSSNASNGALVLLVHSFDGQVKWYDARITKLFDPSPQVQRVVLVSCWTGHRLPVETITRSNTTNAILTSSHGGPSILWSENTSLIGPPLARRSLLASDEDVLYSCFLADGRHLVTLHHANIALWNINQAAAVLLAEVSHALQDGPLGLIQLPQSADSPNKAIIATISASRHGIAWELYLPPPKTVDGPQPNGYHSLLRECGSFSLDGKRDLSHLITLNSVSSSAEEATQDTVVAVTDDGVLQHLTCTIDEQVSGIAWRIVTEVSTHVANASYLRASTSSTVALVSSQKTSLTIWNMPSAHLEFEYHTDEQEAIEALAWSSTLNEPALLAVGLQHRILIFCQSTYRYTDTSPPWVLIQEIRTRDFATQSPEDLCWIRKSNLIIAAGIQIYVHEVEVQSGHAVGKLIRKVTSGAKWEASHVAQRLNTSLPIFHPELLSQLISVGRLSKTRELLFNLQRILRYRADGDELPSDLGVGHDGLLTSQKPGDNSSEQSESDEEVYFDKNLAARLHNSISQINLWQLSKHDQKQLAKLITRVADLERHRQSVDHNGVRFLHAYKTGASDLRTAATWREICFASLSTSQDILVDIMSSHNNNKIHWQQARESGLFTWLSDTEALRQQMEVVARNEYTASEDRSPVNCSLYYLALGKKTVLQGLWRMVPGVREQSNTLKLLANNFNEQRWKTTALKNAYVLLSKRRFVYAAAFFLLGGSLKDAVNVCVHQLKDVQLGIAIARIYEGDESVVLRNLLLEQVLIDAATRGDRWCACWAFGMLGLHDKAIQALIRPVHALVESKTKFQETIHSKHFRNNDPLLAVLYKQLRVKMLQRHRGRSVIEPREEWEFVMRCVRQYIRMGMDWLALDLVRNWKFVPFEIVSIDAHVDVAAHGEDVDATVKDDPKREVTVENKKARPTQFQEPSASSLLDTFGF